ncbi:helix-turn-helix transcriptional regulator [Desulfoferula mesophila]|uniref:Helix-turn-helix domain-containing protein n=1 Tax=Desulfoferula mesophila TaxID=3058419 RepID=A0AAU9EYE6_9BACT|nr:hypothetical protein FAK_24770 [Desulfoferula mesophilus]
MSQFSRLLTTKALADRWGVSNRSLEGRRLRGEGPPFVKIGASVRYRLEDVEAWLVAQTRQSTSDQGPDQDAA